jgi:glycerol-3-phosphate O-acyltransferase
VGEIKDGHEVVYTYDEKRRRALDFYKNNIVHYLVVPSILAQALRQQVTRNKLQEYLFHWVQLLRYEFFLPDRRAVQTRAELYLGHFIAEKLIEEDAAGLHPTPEGQKRLGLYANVLANFREAYFVAIDAALYLETWPTPEKRLLSKMTAAFEKYHLLREVRRVESSNPIFYENAVHYMVKAGYLTRRQVDVGKGKSSNLYDRGDRFNDLADLRRSLIQSLESHDS